MYVIHQHAYAQKILIGTIIDKDAQKPIPFANVLASPSLTGESADENGVFNFTADTHDDSITISAVGYETVTYAVSGEKNQTFKIFLNAFSTDLNAVVVRAGEDPAVILMKKVQRNKELNNRKEIQSYREEVYNKAELDLSNIKVSYEVDSTKKIHPLDFVGNYIDTTTDIKPYLPFFFTETLTDYFYRKQPKTEKEIIKASKVSGFDNATITQFLGNMYTDFNVYDNYLLIIGKNFVSPLADSWQFYYKLDLADSAYIDNVWCYKLIFTPKQKQENVFMGDMWIADSTYAVKKIAMQINANANINFLDRVSFYQEFQLIDSTYWMLTKDKLLMEFSTSGKAMSIIGRKTTVHQKFIFENAAASSEFNTSEDIIVNDSVINNSEDFWSKVRPEKLSENEENVYEMVDSLKNIPQFNSFITIFKTVVSGYFNLHYIELGPYFKTITSNTEEGFRIRIGVRTGEAISKRFVLGAYAAYGFKDEKFKYGGNFDIALSKKPWQKTGVNYQNDLFLSSDNSSEFGQDNILSGIYRRKNIPQKFINIEQFSWYYKRDWAAGLSNKISGSHTIMNPKFDFSYFTENNYSDSISSTINNAEISLETRFAYHEKFITEDFRRTSLGTKFPVLALTYSLGVKNISGSDFSYNKLEFNVEDYIDIANIGESYYHIKAGKYFGNLPALLLESPTGNQTYIYDANAFNLMNEYEFLTDTYVELMYAHHFGGFFLNKMPLIRLLKLREVFTFRCAYGTISSENKFINSYKAATAPYYIGNTSPYPKPYMEAGVGIENIFKIFRVDAIWRLTYRNNPVAPNFGIRLGIYLDV